MTATERMVGIFREVFPEYVLESGSYGGGAERYATYEERYTGDAYADDLPKVDRVKFELILFAPRGDKLRVRIRQFRMALTDGGFSWPELVRDENAMQQQWLLLFEGMESVVWEC